MLRTFSRFSHTAKSPFAARQYQPLFFQFRSITSEAHMETHKAAVARISSSVKDFYDQRKPFRIYHGSTNSTRQSSRNSSNTVDASALKNVLKVDIEAKVAWVEPNVAMDELVAETLKHGLVPKVVMEFPGKSAILFLEQQELVSQVLC